VKKILDEDSYCIQVVPLFCAILIELKKLGKLYHIAHKLVSNDADSAVSWFAVVSLISV
jgi:DNA-binding FrmR family transcriptional regulator